MLPAIQSLWVGPELTLMEQLAIASFLHHGHPFHLYAYDEIRNVPEGAVLKDASAILPSSAIFQYTEFESYSGFSNFFRYKLLLEVGGWWSDTDMVCLRPFDFADDYVFSSEVGLTGFDVNCGVIKAPASSEVMARAWDTCRNKDPRELAWGETGPLLLAALVAELSLDRWVRPVEVFCPVGPACWADLIDPEASWSFAEPTRGVHLWNELWRRNERSKNRRYPAGCLYEELKRTYLSEHTLRRFEQP